VAKDSGNDGLLAILTPQAMASPTRTAEGLKPYANTEGKPILASWMGGAEVMAGEAILNKAGIPTFPYPDIAARVFNYMWKYSFNLRALYETPSLPPESEEDSINRARAEENIRAARKSGRTILTELESKQLLSAFGIPIVETRHAANEEEAVQESDKMGYPVVLKIHSMTITHKTDVGGVRLGLKDAVEVRAAFHSIEASVKEMAGAEHFQGVTVQPMVQRGGYEVILGSSFDPQFGPVLLFGSGGQLVEVFRDRALALPPLNTTLAQRLMEETLIYRALKCVRGGKPIDLLAMEQLIVRFSQLVVALPAIKEIDINPLLASSEGLIALDARVVLHGPGVSEDRILRPVIRPYPLQYVSQWTLKNGESITIRPIRPEDEPQIVKFHESLSERSIYFRYFQVLKLSQRIAHERLARICFIDYNRQMSLVACRKNPRTGEKEIFGVGRLTKVHGAEDAEFAILISDPFQNSGLGTEFLGKLIQVARDEKLSRIIADILPENLGMMRVCEKSGFRLFRDPDDPVVKAELRLVE
jgi:acetyltransferase